MISSFSQEESRVLTYKDFTPNRQYIVPMVVGRADSLFVYSEKTSISKTGKRYLKAMSTNTGDLLWYMDAFEVSLETQLIDLQDNFALLSDELVYIIDYKGNVLSQYKLEIENHK